MSGKFLSFIYTCFAFFVSDLVIETNYDVVLLVGVVHKLTIHVQLSLYL